MKQEKIKKEIPMENENIHLYARQMGYVLPKEYYYKRMLFYWMEEMENSKVGDKYIN